METQPANAPGESRRSQSSTLTRGTIYNLIGLGLPMVAALVCAPFLVKGLGPERFGLLTIAWVVIGYFSLFDFGLGRALTQMLAERLGAGQEHSIPPLVWTAMILMTALGILGALTLIGISPWLVTNLLNVTPELQAEAIQTFFILGISVPFVVTTVAMRGILEALQRFDLVNLLRLPLSLLTYIGPLLVLTITTNLAVIVSVLLAGRLIIWAAHGVVCLRELPSLRKPLAPSPQLIRPLLSFGGWMMVANLLSPLLATLDRFLIGSMVSVAAVSYYALPQDMVAKLAVVPSALAGVLFPVFAATSANQGRTAQLFWRGVKYVFLLVFPIVLVVLAFAPEGLSLWVDSSYAAQSYRVLQILAAGMLVNTLAQIPYTLVQGLGRPDITAKLLFIELPLFLILLTVLTRLWGVTGAALAWSLRVVIDAGLLFIASARLLPQVRRSLPRVAALIALTAMTATTVLVPSTLWVRAVACALSLCAVAAYALIRLLDAEERALIRARLSLWLTRRAAGPV